MAAVDGAAVSADPGESGDGGVAVDAPAPRDRLTGGGDPAEGGSADDGQFHPDSQPDQPSGAAPGDHLTGGGDPAEGKR